MVDAATQNPEFPQLWIDRLPLRWSRNAGLALLLVLLAASTRPFVQSPTDRDFLLIGGVSLIGGAGIGYLVGLWARWALTSFSGNDAGKISDAMPSTYATGAIILTGAPTVLIDGAVAVGVNTQAIGLKAWLFSLPIAVLLALIVGAISRMGLSAARKRCQLARCGPLRESP